MSYKCLADVLQMSCRCFTAVSAEQRYVWNSSVFTFYNFLQQYFSRSQKVYDEIIFHARNLYFLSINTIDL